MSQNFRWAVGDDSKPLESKRDTSGYRALDKVELVLVLDTNAIGVRKVMVESTGRCGLTLFANSLLKKLPFCYHFNPFVG